MKTPSIHSELYSQTNLLDLVLTLIYVLFILRQFSIYIKIDRKIGFFSLLMGLMHFFVTFISYSFVISGSADAKYYYWESTYITDWGLSYFSNGKY